MNLFLTDEQKMLADSVARLFAKESSTLRVRAAESTGFDPGLWDSLVAMGIPLLRLPEEAGGSGAGLLEAVLITEQAGRHLASVPLAEALPVAGLLAQLDTTAAADLLERIRDGALVTLAPLPQSGDQPVCLPALGVAEAVLLLDGKQLFSVNARHAIHQADNLGSDCLAIVQPGQLEQVTSRELVASGDSCYQLFQAAIEEWKLLKAAMLYGLAERAIQMAAEYSRERIQFGRPIGGYQGIAHPLADAITDMDGTRLLTWHAVSAISKGDNDAAALVSMAWWWATQAAPRATATALRTFGGYGVSVEYDIQLYYRRARAWSLLRGDPQTELDQIGRRLWSTGTSYPLPNAGETDLEFGCGADAESFADEARAFFSSHLTEELQSHAHHSVDGYHAGFNRQLAEAGLLYPHWPEAFGGRGKSPFDMAALQEVFEEFNWQRITAPITNQVAQITMRFASEALKEEVLPRFGSGEALACLGFSEPTCGSDVFAARTRAEVTETGDWLINGQKIFTTAGNLADYIFLLVRTDPDAPKHAGLTLFLAPMNMPGIDVHPVHTLQDERTNITYLSDVRLSDHYRIGEVNQGVAVMAATLELEHGGDQYRISYSNMLRHALQWARTTRRGDRSRLDDDEVRRRLARVATHTTIARSLCYRAIWGVMHQVPGRAAFGPMSKVFSTEYYRRDASDLMELFAPQSLLQNQNDELELIELGYRQSIGMTIYGGTSEIQRSLIAEQALGMPKSRS
ncbi:MAG TPA: acyl-CoA dehydrogenase [Pseudomonas xinjiangensis]|uniref:Acyl-CoA dehydrogenase n=2 Tax=root TaxID=1 RepID=A0A7V1FTB3_9GAMM|nr:acyl-CoA dehydrogenase [Halopseudomonas xinjiangensis]HEC47380.1 acyl-CoA dehydrogenase [Halopseudomonas xinjiangensis]